MQLCSLEFGCNPFFISDFLGKCLYIQEILSVQVHPYLSTSLLGSTLPTTIPSQSHQRDKEFNPSFHLAFFIVYVLHSFNLF